MFAGTVEQKAKSRSGYERALTPNLAGLPRIELQGTKELTAQDKADNGHY